MIDGGNCGALSLWKKELLKPDADGSYSIMPPEPKKEGHWTGYYIELRFPGDTSFKGKQLKNQFTFSTPGYTWPNTLPFSDCSSLDGTCKD